MNKSLTEIWDSLKDISPTDYPAVVALLEVYRRGYLEGAKSEQKPSTWHGLYPEEASILSFGKDPFSGSYMVSNKIQCIKAIREKRNIPLKDAKDLVDNYCQKVYGV